jgi:serine/threonine-protein kinase RsbW
MKTTEKKYVASTELELKIKSGLQYLSLVRSFIKSINDMNKFSDDEIFQITLVLDEAVANVIEHGYKLNENNEILIKILIDHEKIEIRIIDYSAGFSDFDKFKKVNLDQHKKERRNRGLGVFIIKKIMDSVDYKLDSKNGNVLKLVKYFSHGDK